MNRRTTIGQTILLAAFLLSAAGNAVAQNQAIFGGGDADGASGDVMFGGSVAFPQINNSVGATGITDQAAWLNGSLTSTSASPTTVRVYWGTVDQTNNIGAWENWTNFGVRTEWSDLTTNVTLSIGTIYYYRFYATNDQGEAWAWPAASFQTLAAPVVTNDGASHIASTYAILHGTMTEGVLADIYVYFGQNTNSWSVTNYFTAQGNGAFSTNMTGLSKDATYYYRCYASNAYGTNWSAVANFTTCDDSMYGGGNNDGHYCDMVVALASIVFRGTVFMIR